MMQTCHVHIVNVPYCSMPRTPYAYGSHQGAGTNLYDALAHCSHCLVPVHQVQPATHSSSHQTPVQPLLLPVGLEGTHAAPHQLMG